MERKSGGNGRKKVEMVKINNESNLQVTFSKRRSGIFKKASELSTLCGAEVAVFIFSPGKKVFSFGHPSVEFVIEKFLSRHPPELNGVVDHLVEVHRDASIRELNNKLAQVEAMVEEERKLGEAMSQMIQAAHGKNWFTAPIDELNLQQLELMEAALVDLRMTVTKKLNDFMIKTLTPQPLTAVPGSSGRGGMLVDGNAPGSGGGGAVAPHGYGLGYGLGLY